MWGTVLACWTVPVFLGRSERVTWGTVHLKVVTLLVAYGVLLMVRLYSPPSSPSEAHVSDISTMFHMTERCSLIFNCAPTVLALFVVPLIQRRSKFKTRALIAEILDSPMLTLESLSTTLQEITQGLSHNAGGL